MSFPKFMHYKTTGRLSRNEKTMTKCLSQSSNATAKQGSEFQPELPSQNLCDEPPTIRVSFRSSSSSSCWRPAPWLETRKKLVPAKIDRPLVWNSDENGPVDLHICSSCQLASECGTMEDYRNAKPKCKIADTEPVSMDDIRNMLEQTAKAAWLHAAEKTHNIRNDSPIFHFPDPEESLKALRAEEQT